MSARIAIVTHGGPRVGVGHLRRCLTLAHALRDRGADPWFIVARDDASEHEVGGASFACTPVDSLDPPLIREALASLKARASIADSYEFAVPHFEVLREIGPVAALDDTANRLLPVDLVWNGGVQAERLSYDALVPPICRRLIGPAYALLAAVYRDAAWREPAPSVQRAFVTVGGADPAQALPHLLDAALAALPEAVIDLVVGPYVAVPPGASAEGRVRVHRAPSDLSALMAGADLAVSAGGQTTYELAATGTPAVVVTVADNQRPQVEEFARRGTIVDAGDARRGAETYSRVRAELERLAHGVMRRVAMSRAGAAVIDGAGADRTAARILDLC